MGSTPALGYKMKKDKEDLLTMLKFKKRNMLLRGTVKEPTTIDKLMHTRIGQKTTVSYFTESKSIAKKHRTKRDVLNEASPFMLPTVWIVKERGRHGKKSVHRSKKSYLQPTHRGRQFQDLLERVYIPTDTTFIPRSQHDVDENYFKVIQGRPIARKFRRQQFINTVRQTFLANLTTGFVRDQMLRINERALLRELYVSEKDFEYKDLVHNIDNYFADDNDESLKMITAGQDIMNRRKDKAEEVKSIRHCMDAIKGSLTKLNAVFYKQRLCKEVLYYISPSEWQDEYQILKEESKLKVEQEISKVWEYYKQFEKYEGTDIQVKFVVTQLTDQMRRIGPAENFFKEAWQVDLIYREIELQNLRCLSHITAIRQLRDKIKFVSETLVKFFKDDLKSIEALITETENCLVYHRDRSRYLQKITMQRLNSSFKELTSGEECLNTMALVQDLYERIIGANENDLDCLSMMRGIEAAFCDLQSQLKEVKTTTIRNMVNKETSRKRSMMAKASRAIQRQKQVEIMLGAAQKTYDPAISWTSYGKQLKWRSKPPMKRTKEIHTKDSEDDMKVQVVTKPKRQDWQRLKLFVDYSEDEDNDKYQNEFDLDKELEERDEEEPRTPKYDTIIKTEEDDAEESRNYVSMLKDDVASLDSDWTDWWNIEIVKEESKEVPDEMLTGEPMRSRPSLPTQAKEQL